MSIKNKKPRRGQKTRLEVRPERLEKQAIPDGANGIFAFLDDDDPLSRDPFEGMEFEDVYLEPIPIEKQRS